MKSRLLNLLATTIAAGAALPAMAQDDAGLDEIIVQGRAQALYRVGETTSGKLPTAPLASSLNIQVINADLIHDQGARDAQDIYRNISGVTVFSYAGVTARGFRQEEVFFDGLRGDPYAGFSVPQLFNIERLEFLKGPAGMLYGPTAPGGVFNYVTKKPDHEFSAHATAIAGNYSRFGGSTEMTGGLTDTVATRLGVFYESRDLPRYNADNETLIFDSGVTIDVSERSHLLLQVSHYDQDLGANRLRGVPTDDDGYFLANRKWNHNEPGDFLKLSSTTLSARFDTELSDDLTWDVAVRYNPSEESQQYHEPRGLLDTDDDGVPDTSIREYRDQYRDLKKWSVGTNAIWSQDLGDIKNRLLVGADYFWQDYHFTYRGARGEADGIPNLSLTDPQYGLADPTTYDYTQRPNIDQSQTRAGGYAMNEATFGKLIAVVGVRFDYFKDIDEGPGLSFNDENVTFRAGLVYRLREDVSVFAQWAESYEPQSLSQQDVNAGGPFSPTEGEMFEGGIRTELFDGRIQANLTAYHIKRANILQADPRGDVDDDGTDDFVAFGEVTSEGVEFDLVTDITRDWLLTLSYAYNDARLTQDNGLTAIDFNVGDRFPNAPKHQLGFWSRYQVADTGLALAGGGDYVSRRVSMSGQTVRPYVVFDASIIYEFGDWSALLRVDNVFDKTYAASGFIDRTGHFPGEPRSFFVELTRRW